MIPIVHTAVRLKIFHIVNQERYELIEGCCPLLYTYNEYQNQLDNSNVNSDGLHPWDTLKRNDKERLHHSFNHEIVRLTNSLMRRAITDSKRDLLESSLEISYERLMVDDIRAWEII